MKQTKRSSKTYCAGIIFPPISKWFKISAALQIKNKTYIKTFYFFYSKKSIYIQEKGYWKYLNLCNSG